jgi:hypothetical protein
LSFTLLLDEVMGCPIFFGESVLKGTTWADFNIEACQRVGFNALSSPGVPIPSVSLLAGPA